MGWGLRVIVPNRVVYVDYTDDASVSDVGDALAGVLDEVEKRRDASQMFYCVSGATDTSSGGASITALNDVFRTFKQFPENTKTIMVIDSRLTGFLAGLVHSMRNLGYKHERTIEGAIREIARDEPELAALLKPDDFKLRDEDIRTEDSTEETQNNAE